jgi:hypothetical protein
MISKFLLPHIFKIIGWVIFIPSFILGILWTAAGFEFKVNSPVFALWADNGQFFTIISQDIYNEIIAVPLLISLMFISFAREKNEDEYLTRIRLESLTWSIYVNTSILILSWIFIFGGGFYNIMVYNMFTVLILFIVKFYSILYKNKKQLENEK